MGGAVVFAESDWEAADVHRIFFSGRAEVDFEVEGFLADDDVERAAEELDGGAGAKLAGVGHAVDLKGEIGGDSLFVGDLLKDFTGGDLVGGGPGIIGEAAGGEDEGFVGLGDHLLGGDGVTPGKLAGDETIVENRSSGEQVAGIELGFSSGEDR